MLSSIYVREPEQARAAPTHRLDRNRPPGRRPRLAPDRAGARGDGRTGSRPATSWSWPWWPRSAWSAFVVWELTTKHPVVDLRVLRSRTLATAAALTFVLGFALFATVFIVPVFVQRLLGLHRDADRHALPAGSRGVGRRPAAVGRMLVKGVPPQFLVVTGFVVVAVFAYMLSRLDLSRRSAATSSGRSSCGPSGCQPHVRAADPARGVGAAAPRHPAGRGLEQHDAPGRRLVRHRLHQHLPRPPDRPAPAGPGHPAGARRSRDRPAAAGS